MKLLDDKRKSQGYGNPEFFTAGPELDDIRIRRDSVISYKTEINAKPKEPKYQMKIVMSYGNVYCYTTDDKQIAEKFMSKLDKLFNVKQI